MKQDRLNRAQSISKKLIGEYFIQDLQELSWDFWIITVLEAKISQDLSYLDVYVSSLQNCELLTKTLAEHAHKIQHMLGRKIDFIKVPKVRFRYDETWESSFDIYQTIQNLDTK